MYIKRHVEEVIRESVNKIFTEMKCSLSSVADAGHF
jgi:hypothetical protein